MKTKICLSLTEELLKEIDICAARSGQSRSSFVEIMMRTALAESPLQKLAIHTSGATVSSGLRMEDPELLLAEKAWREATAYVWHPLELPEDAQHPPELVATVNDT